MLTLLLVCDVFSCARSIVLKSLHFQRKAANPSCTQCWKLEMHLLPDKPSHSEASIAEASVKSPSYNGIHVQLLVTMHVTHLDYLNTQSHKKKAKNWQYLCGWKRLVEAVAHICLSWPHRVILKLSLLGRGCCRPHLNQKLSVCMFVGHLLVELGVSSWFAVSKSLTAFLVFGCVSEHDYQPEFPKTW